MESAPAAAIESHGTRLKELQPAFVRHVVSSLGGMENVQVTKLAEALGCTYNTLVGYLREVLQGEK